jgi:acetyl esterase/lipase
VCEATLLSRTYTIGESPFECYTCLLLINQSNVIAIDYRGFGDSSGTPSEPGLLTDARAAWDYVVSKMADNGVQIPEENIVLAGQSLGTGVVAGLAGILAKEQIKPRALVMIAPFSSVKEVVQASAFRIMEGQELTLQVPFLWFPSPLQTSGAFQIFSRFSR